jgi:hypothetical protein
MHLAYGDNGDFDKGKAHAARRFFESMIGEQELFAQNF